MFNGSFPGPGSPSVDHTIGNTAGMCVSNSAREQTAQNWSIQYNCILLVCGNFQNFMQNQFCTTFKRLSRDHPWAHEKRSLNRTWLLNNGVLHVMKSNHYITYWNMFQRNTWNIFMCFWRKSLNRVVVWLYFNFRKSQLWNFVKIKSK